jgi:hypothetical protein
VQRLAKLLQLLSVNIQLSENMPSPMQTQPNSVTGIIWESVFSTEFKHANIAVNGTVAVRERDIGYTCAMGATALDAFVPGRTYRCRVRVVKKVWSMVLGVALQNIACANKF